MIKAWINEQAVHYPAIRVNYVGGDPRFIFESKFLVRCEVDGQVINEEVEEKSEEINIKTYDVPMIEALLAERGIEKKIVEPEPEPEVAVGAASPKEEEL